MKKYIPCLAALLDLCLLSCEKEIRFRQPLSEPKLVLECVARPDTALRVRLSRSRFFLENTDRFSLVNDAELKLSVNDAPAVRMAYDDAGWYEASYIPRCGDRLSLEAQTPSLPPVHAEETVIEGVSRFVPGDSVSSCSAFPVQEYYVYPDDHVTCIDVRKGNTNELVFVESARMPDSVAGVVTRDYRYKLEFVFQDRPGRPDYYQMSVKAYENAGTEDNPCFYESSVQLESRSLKTSNYYQNLDDEYEESQWWYTAGDCRFTDEFFDGEEVRLSIVVNHLCDYDVVTDRAELIPVSSGRQIRLVVTLTSLSESSYLFSQSRASAAEESLTGLFSEPVQIFSNISGGIGIFGSACDRYSEVLLTTPNFSQRTFDPIIYTDYLPSAENIVSLP
ncbi:MAG: DUF4249 domain-containing protein [Bacteroidales bacterium]|nr:DUF4249 domain-containing protein [Bacteroidales bacterium]